VSNQSVKKKLSFIWQLSKACKHLYICIFIAQIFAGYAVKTLIDTIASDIISCKFFIYLFLIYISRLPLSLNDYPECKIYLKVSQDVTLKAYQYLQNHSYIYLPNNISGSLIIKLISICKGLHTLWNQVSNSIVANISIILCNDTIIDCQVNEKI
jgi:ATP-binding cassette, subfamily B, bacterial